MSDRYRQTMRAGRKRLVRTASVLFALMVCVLLVQAATANADVMKKYRAAYKSKLNYYRNQMDTEKDTFFSAWKQAAESTSYQLSVALADTEHPENIEIIKSVAVDQRKLLQDATTKSRNKIYANIGAFKAKAVDWFKSKADQSRFKTRMATMKSGFKQMYSADESLMTAFYYLGVNADVASANEEIMTAGLTSVTAEDLFEKGLNQLRALQ